MLVILPSRVTAPANIIMLLLHVVILGITLRTNTDMSLIFADEETEADGAQEE